MGTFAAVQPDSGSSPLASTLRRASAPEARMEAAIRDATQMTKAGSAGDSRPGFRVFGIEGRR